MKRSWSNGMSTDFALISNIPIAWFFDQVIGSCGWREATSEEVAARNAARAVGEAKYHKQDSQAERITTEIIKKRLQIAVTPNYRFVMSSPAPAAEAGHEPWTDWLIVAGNQQGCHMYLGPVYKWADTQQEMLDNLIRKIHSLDFTATVYSEHEPQYWGYETPEEITEFEEYGPCGFEGRIADVWWKDIDGHQWKLTRDDRGRWVLYYPPIAELSGRDEQRLDIAKIWIAELGYQVDDKMRIGFRGGAAAYPYKVSAHDHFGEETRPALIEYYRTGNNPFEPSTNGHAWAAWIKPQIDRDPSLLDENRRDDLEALWNEAWRTTTVMVNVKTGEIRSGSPEAPLPPQGSNETPF
jgi:hypothetical protein